VNKHIWETITPGGNAFVDELKKVEEKYDIIHLSISLEVVRVVKTIIN
jgi:hypothetical protein